MNVQLSQRNVVLIGDTLVVKDSGGYLIYSPFTSLITRSEIFPESDSEAFEQLRQEGFFSSLPATVGKDTEWNGFKSLTLLMTRNCNLRCVYCYACGGEAAHRSRRTDSMPEELMIDAVNWFVSQLKDDDPLRITFHGGGEPTLEAKKIQQAVEVANKLRGNRKLRYFLVSNGTFPESFLDWMIQNELVITISADGPADIQNRNRPFFGGRPSSLVVEDNMRKLVSRGYPFTVRVTYSLGEDMERVIRYFGDLGIKNIHLEPLFPYGRSYERVDLRGEIRRSQSASFVDKFVLALDICREYGIRIYNGHLTHFTDGIGYFCGGARGTAMMVTHDGLLTGCLEVVDGEDDDIGAFQTGFWNQEFHSFEIDADRIRAFQRRHADEISPCSDCFARYVCAGGCAVKAFRATGDFLQRDISYCSFTRSIVPLLVQRIAVASGV